MGWNLLIEIIFGGIKTWWTTRAADTERKAGEAALILKEANEKDIKNAEEIRTAQGNLSDSDVDRLLTRPEDRPSSNK